MAKAKKPGSVFFEEYFAEIYQQRWPKLYQALKEKPEKTFFQWSEKFPKYELDRASKIVAEALPISKGDRVLDLCAAPGGKSLFLAKAIGDSGKLVANELSKERRGRLKRVLGEHLPVAIDTEVTGHDGSKWGLYQKNEYDAVLVDAPCSGERHLLEKKSELELWSPSRGKNLAHRQYALLASAYLAAKDQSYIMYSTCSINPVENDLVIAKILKKKQGLSLVDVEVEMGEKTEFGWQILPDESNCGPMYLSLLEKKIQS